MAMGAMQQITALGTSTNMQTPNSSESTAAIDDLILHVKNASGASINVTITDPGLTPPAQPRVTRLLRFLRPRVRSSSTFSRRWPLLVPGSLRLPSVRLRL
jgi:hypothetical protein